MERVVTPRWRPGHLQHIYATLTREPSGRDTALGPALTEVARLCRKRTLILLISDFLPPVDTWARELGELTAARHDVRALQVLDPAELNLNFGRAAVWQDLEDGASHYIDPAQAREGYQSRINAHLEEVKATFQRHGALHHLTTTDQPMADSLVQFLQARRGQPAVREEASA